MGAIVKLPGGMKGGAHLLTQQIYFDCSYIAAKTGGILSAGTYKTGVQIAEGSIFLLPYGQVQGNIVGISSFYNVSFGSKDVVDIGTSDTVDLLGEYDNGTFNGTEGWVPNELLNYPNPTALRMDATLDITVTTYADSFGYFYFFLYYFDAQHYPYNPPLAR
jgi:hypothetical protein